MNYHLRSPGLKLTTILFGLAILVCGCSSSYTVSSTGKPNSEYSYQKLNEELTGRDVNIELKDEREISAKEVKIAEDSISWVDERTDKRSKISIGELNRIVTKNHLLGGLEGMGLGLVSGAGLGAAVGGLFPSKGREIVPTWFAGGVLGGAAGMIIIGPITGMIIGHSYNYEFSTTEQSDSLQHGK